MATTRRAALGAMIAGLLVLTSCSGDDDPAAGGGDDPLSVVAAFYPLEEMARAVGGDRVEVTNLTPPGVSPHELEVDPGLAAAAAEADVLLFLGRGFQPLVEDVVGQSEGTAVDLLDAVDLLPVDPQLAGTQGEVDGEVLEGDVDPHVWLDPARMIAMVDAVEAALAEADPDGAPAYATAAEQYVDSLDGLDGAYRTGLDDCDSRVIVTSHRAFGYLADSYDLRQIPIAGISPDDAPDPRTLEAIAAEAEVEGVTTVFLEEIAPPDLAETVAAEIGAELSLLDPIEGFTEEDLAAGADYATTMAENLDRLVDGLGCAP